MIINMHAKELNNIKSTLIIQVIDLTNGFQTWRSVIMPHTDWQAVSGS